MTTYEITVDGQRVDTRNLNINIQLTHYDPYDITLRGSSFTYSFDLPTTKRNNTVFGNRNDWSVIGKFNTVYTGRIYVNSDIVIEGQLIIDSITKDFYKVKIQSNDWILNFRNKSLRDLQNYTAPFTGNPIPTAPYYVEEAGIQDYIDDVNPEKKIAFPLISYGTFYNPYKRFFYLLDVTGNRAGQLPSGDYALQDGTCFTIIDGLQDASDPIPIEDGYHKVWALPKVGAPSIDVEVYAQKYYVDDQPDTRCFDLEVEDYTPSFYYLEIIKKIFEDSGISVEGEIFQDPKFTNLVLPYVGSDEFQWNWNRLGYMKAVNLSGRSEIDSRFQMDPIGILPSLPINYATFCNNFFDPTTAQWALPDGFIDAEGANSFLITTAKTPVKRTFIVNYDDSFISPFGETGNMVNTIRLNGYSVQALGEMQHSQYVVPITGSYSGKAKVSVVGTPYVTNPTNVSLKPDNYTTPTSSIRNRVMLGIFRTEGFADFQSIDDNYLEIGWNGFTSDRVLASVELTDDNTFELLSGTFDLEFNNVILNENDRVFVAIVTLGKGDNVSPHPYWTDICGEFTYSEFEIIPDRYDKDTNPNGFTWDIDIARNLPDMKQLDFIKNFLFLFNLYYEFDLSASRIEFKSLNKYTDPLIYPPINLDEYSSIVDAVAERIPSYNKIDVGYSYDEKDFLISKTEKNNFNYIFNDDSFTTSLVNTNPKEEYTFNCMFSPTLLRPFTFRVVNGDVAVLSLPSISDEDNYFKPSEDVNWSYDYTSRILLYQGRNKLNLYTSYNTGGDSNQFSLVYPGTAVFPNYLNFNTLYSNYYNNIFENIKESHIASVKAVLDQSLFKELNKHPRLVKWNNDYYIILSIQYNILTGVSNLKLLKYV